MRGRISTGSPAVSPVSPGADPPADAFPARSATRHPVGVHGLTARPPGVSLSKVLIGAEEERLVLEVLRSGRLAQGEKVAAL
jgi:hypothetical protein